MNNINKAQELLANYNNLEELVGTEREVVLGAHAATCWAKAMGIPGGPWESHDKLLHSPEFWSNSVDRRVWTPSSEHPELLGTVIEDQGDFALIEPFNGDTTVKAYDLGGFSVLASSR